jgi:hypothetical protein
MPFSPDYFSARDRFRAGVRQALPGVHATELPIAARGPREEALTVDVARFGKADASSVLVVTSGLHGCEGIFGSAVQVAALAKWAQSPPPENVGVVLVHILNPYGFAWMRRTNEDNIDLNRNFLAPGEKYEGCPPLYRDLDALLNPKRPPSRWEPFQLRAYAFILRHGLPALMQATAGGQYEFPQGLFFGGRGPSETLRILQEHLPRWVEGATRVLHLDFHTGLGRHGTYKLLTDDPLTAAQAAWLRPHFGSDAIEEYTQDDATSAAARPAAAKTAYATRGSLGHWCAALVPDKNYAYFCAEFGTYPPLKVISGLRAENQAHFWDKPDSPNTRRTKERLQELLNPASPAWRRTVIEKSTSLLEQALQALAR